MIARYVGITIDMILIFQKRMTAREIGSNIPKFRLQIFYTYYDNEF